MRKPTDKALRVFLRDMFINRYTVQALIAELIDIRMIAEYNEVVEEYIEHKEND